MNENPEGTPNPLNPNPAPTATGPAPQPSAPVTESTQEPPMQNTNPAVTPIDIVSKPAGQAPMASQPEVTPEATTEPAPAEPMPVGSTPVEPTMSQSTQQGDITIPPAKKSKKSLIALLVIFILVAIGCGVAAIILLNPFGTGDRVPAAIEKVLKNGVPANLGVNGTITATNDGDESTLSDIAINLDAQFSFADQTNKAKAGINVNFKDDTSLDFDAEEITNKDGDMFIKLSGIADAYNSLQSGLTTQVTTDQSCVTDADGTTDCVTVQNVSDVCEGEACNTIQNNSTSELGYIGTVLQMLETVDEEWIRIPAESAETTDEITLLNNPTKCISDAMAKLPTYGDNLVNVYKENPFLEYSTENISIPAVKDTIYRIKINDAKFTNFVNATRSNEFANALLACTNGVATNDGLEESEVTEIIKNYPTIYVEINENYDFTRVVLESSNEAATIKADLRLTYPESVSVTDPDEYLEINQVIQAIMKDLYGVTTLPEEGTTTDIEVVETVPVEAADR